MKIKEMLMVLQAGDASDHWDSARRDEEPDRQWYHDSDKCDYCAAARAAERLAVVIDFPGFEAGETVELVSGVRGRVMGTELVVRVEVHGPRGHGPYAIGTFRPGDLKAVAAETSTYWLDTKGGDTWERRESDHLMRIVYWGDHGNGGYAVESPMSWDTVTRKEKTRTFDAVSEWYGPLTQVEKP